MSVRTDKKIVLTLALNVKNMEIIKKGSKGESVKVLQKYLGITQDGVFGANTEAAVKKFQSKAGLTADGVVGVKTWAALGMNTVENKAVDDCVIYNPLSVHITPYKGRAIKYLAIHFTAGSSSQGGRAMNVKRTFETSPASADFCVDDRDIVQFNPDPRNYYCWAVGDKRQLTGGASLNGVASNKNTISIEICSSCKAGFSTAIPNHEGWYFTDAVLNNAVKIAKILMKTYNIPIERVVRHYDITGKLCPALVGWNDHYIVNNNGTIKKRKNDSEQWQLFKARLK